MKLRRILVPLDGSRLAEAVLPAAAAIAGRLAATVVLLHVLERRPPHEVHGERHLARADAAAAYLDAHAARFRSAGLDVEVDVHAEPVVDVSTAVCEHAAEHHVDLIAMCTHGRTNPVDRVLGSIAARILRDGPTPVLLRTVRRPDADAFELRMLLVPVDFAHDVDAALDAARTLGAAFGAAVTLLSVPQPDSPAAGLLLPRTTALGRELACEDARRRLDELAGSLRADVADVRTSVVDRRPAQAILDATASLDADLTILVTHARTGLSAWLDPSTGQQLLARPALTLLLIKQR